MFQIRKRLKKTLIFYTNFYRLWENDGKQNLQMPLAMIYEYYDLVITKLILYYRMTRIHFPVDSMIFEEQKSYSNLSHLTDVQLKRKKVFEEKLFLAFSTQFFTRVPKDLFSQWKSSYEIKNCLMYIFNLIRFQLYFYYHLRYCNDLFICISIPSLNLTFVRIILLSCIWSLSFFM
jgi:hypothetical protein